MRVVTVVVLRPAVVVTVVPVAVVAVAAVVGEMMPVVRAGAARRTRPTCGGVQRQALAFVVPRPVMRAVVTVVVPRPAVVVAVVPVAVAAVVGEMMPVV